RVYKEKEEQVGEDALRVFEKSVMLQTLDNHWKEHLSMMDHLRHSVFLSGYAQKDPKQEYKRESFVLFSNMLDDVKYDVIKVLSTVQVEGAEEVEAAEKERQRQAAQQQMYYHHAEDPNTADENSNSEEENHTPYRRDQKVGRNAPCPCGSGKKYKQCCGKL
ncbi:MAG: SEC-C domain-containing protein, partial [Gammaproteobacteria bacterium]|nr:SEC-C domain-containing protein [Gammaproteobacteria bacterium]